MGVVRLPYAPRWYQQEIHDAMRRFSVLVEHRRMGKTVLAVNDLIRETALCPNPNPRTAYICPLYRQAKRVAWTYVKQFTRPIPGMDYREGELTACFPNGGELMLLGGSNADALRGMYLDAVVLDETAQLSPEVWSTVVRPCLADRKGKAVFIGTPAGRFNLFHDLYEYAREAGDPDWLADLRTVDDTDALDDEEVNAMRREMSEAEFEQELYCSFDAAVRGAFWADLLDDAQRGGRIREVPYDPQLPTVTSWDLGLMDATVVTFWQVAPTEVRCIDCESYHNTSLPDVIAHIQATKSYAYADHIAPHDIKVRELGSGTSRLEVARANGVDFQVAPNWRIHEGIEAVRSLLPRVYFDAKNCRKLIEALRLYRAEYNDKTRQYQKQPVHDWTSDFADSVRMFAVSQATRALASPQTALDFRPTVDMEAHWRAERERIAI